MTLKRAVLTLLVVGGMYAGASMIGDRLNSTPINSNNRPEIIQSVYAEEELTLEKIAEEVQNKTVEQILEGSKIEYLNDNNLQDKAFRSGKKGLLFLYHNIPNFAEQKRMALIWREIIKCYSDINLFVYKKEGTLTKQDYIYRRTGAQGLPAIAMLSNYDILTKQKYKQNIVIDILAGGPTKDKTVLTMIKELPEFWINSNLYSKAPSDGKVYRFNNTFNYQEVGKFE